MKIKRITGVGGDHIVSVTHRDGTVVTITVSSPKPVEMKVIKGFAP
jgi:hypothetical protein